MPYPSFSGHPPRLMGVALQRQLRHNDWHALMSTLASITSWIYDWHPYEYTWQADSSKPSRNETSVKPCIVDVARYTQLTRSRRPPEVNNIVLAYGVIHRVSHGNRRVDIAAVSSTSSQHKCFALGTDRHPSAGGRAAGSSARPPYQAAGSPAHFPRQAPVRRAPTIAWGAARVLHRSRLLIPPDTACESLGSWMKYSWNPRRNMTATNVADCVHLAQAGVQCVGADRDELLVREVARLLTATNTRPRSQQTSLPSKRAAAKHTETLRKKGPPSTMSAGYTASAEDIFIDTVASAKDRRRFCKSRSRSRTTVRLPPAMAAGITDATDQTGHLAALPVNTEQLHAQQRGVTHSVNMGKVRKWQDSKQGRAWAEERKMLLSADAPDDAPDELHPA